VSGTSPPTGPPLAPLPTTDAGTDEVVHRRRKWPFLLAGVGVLIGVGVVIAVLAGGGTNSESVAATTTTVDDCARAPDPVACRNAGAAPGLSTPTTSVRISFDQSNYSLASSDPDAYKFPT
jgi:hypothetical protein